MSSVEEASVAESSSATVIHGEDVSIQYGKVKAIEGVSFHVNEGEVVGIIGPNGAGKSTLADAVTGFLEYDGTLQYKGAEIRNLTPADLVERGLIHCTESRDLFGFMSVEDNLKMGAFSRGWDDSQERIDEVFDIFPHLEDRRDQNARTLSGGEQQMLAIGRSLMGNPDTLLLDEPTLGLAPVILEDISNSIEDITADGMTVLLCEQNVTFTMKHADRIYLVENGSFVKEGTPDELRGDEYVRDVYLGE